MSTSDIQETKMSCFFEIVTVRAVSEVDMNPVSVERVVHLP
jgi:hypothetical protein